MALTPEGYKELLMTATQLTYTQFRQDLEVRIAAMLKLRTTGLGYAVMESMAREAAKQITERINYMDIETKTTERTVDKLL